jgi:hypothetical protein
MNRRINLFLFISVLTIPFSLSAQSVTNIFWDIQLKSEDSVYTLSNFIQEGNDQYLAFEYSEENPIMEVRLYPRLAWADKKMELNPTAAYSLVDSLLWLNDHYFFKVKFNRLSQSDFLNFTFKFPEEEIVVQLKLLPVSNSVPEFPPTQENLFIGEEKSFELIAQNPNNVRIDPGWKKDQSIHYRLERDKGRIFVKLLPQSTGNHSLNISLRVRNPIRNENGTLVKEFTLPELKFAVKSARSAFLNLNSTEFIRNEEVLTENIEVELDYHPTINLEKTYRVENTEEPGGILIAELFTRRILSNGRVLCYLRLYNYHLRNEGYLYIKDGDRFRFITNFDIFHQTEITGIEIKRAGKDWEKSNQVFPGETVDIKLTGESLDKGYFHFDGLIQITKDSINSNRSEIRYTASIPTGITQRRIQIFNNGENTGKSLLIREYKKPRNLDFVNIYTGTDSFNLAEAPQVVLLKNNAIKDIFIDFDREKIDEDGLYGPQVLEIEVSVRAPNNNQIDYKVLRNIKVKPEGSPRSRMYAEDEYTLDPISLNNHLRNNILNLEAWSIIIIKVRSSPIYYAGKGYEKSIELALSSKTTFDIEVSFPAGLITKRPGEEDFSSFGGISMAIIAQFSFYKPGKVNVKRPYQLGAGFLALNAFDFGNDNTERDMAIVGLASFYPVNTGKKFSFPLYLGGGYLLSVEDWFILLGPGIRVSF